MPNTSLATLLSRLGPVTEIRCFDSGSPREILLTAKPGQVAVIPAVLALSRRGAPMFRAKRAVEAVISNGEARIHRPTVESPEALTADLGQAGLSVRKIKRTEG